jgi:hypothetical protein
LISDPAEGKLNLEAINLKNGEELKKIIKRIKVKLGLIP